MPPARQWQCVVCGYIHEGPAPPATCPSCGAPYTAFLLRGADVSEKFRDVRLVEPRPGGFRYVIVGNSSAGRAAAQAIRAVHPAGAVTIVSEESVPFYYRPMLPDFIAGMPAQRLFAAKDGASEGVELLAGVRAERVDPEKRAIVCADGRTMAYDALLLATGASAVTVPWAGAEGEGVFYLRSYADAQRIAQRAAGAKRAVVVGGGLLGLELVRAFSGLGLNIVLLVREPHVLQPTVDEPTAEVVEAALAAQGVELALEEEVVSFAVRDGQVRAVHTSRGRSVPCDIVGVAVGARPRTELAESAGARAGAGVIVNERFETSVPAIFAAGDVAQAYDRVWGEPRVNTSWRNAQEQGELAGLAMAGAEVSFPGAVGVTFQLVAGLPFCTMGLANPRDPENYEVELEASVKKRVVRKLVRRKGKLVGACLLGDMSPAPELERALRGD